MVGAAQAAVTLVGVGAATLGFSRADPAAAIVVGVVATGVGLRAWFGGR